MKKLFKSLSVICLALVLLCPLALVGCDRNYTVKIEIVQNEKGGFVYLKDVNGIPVTGENAVTEGEKFEYYVVPKTGYRISKVVIDGVEQTGYDDSGAYFFIEKVKKNCNVKVYFEAKKYTVTLNCKAEGGVFVAYKTVDVSYGSSLNLNEDIYGGEANKLWYVIDNNKNTYLYNGLEDVSKDIPEGFEDSNLLFVYGNINVYCDKTASELEAMGI